MADVLDGKGVALLAKHYPDNRANDFLDWFTYSDNTIIDGRSKKKACQLFESGILKTTEPGSIRCLQQIHDREKNFNADLFLQTAFGESFSDKKREHRQELFYAA